MDSNESPPIPGRSRSPSIRRRVGVKAVLIFLSAGPSLFAARPVSPSLHPQTLMSDFWFLQGVRDSYAFRIGLLACLAAIVTLPAPTCSSHSQSLQPFAASCKTDGGSPGNDLAAVGKVAIDFVRNALDPNPEAAESMFTADAEMARPSTRVERTPQGSAGAGLLCTILCTELADRAHTCQIAPTKPALTRLKPMHRGESPAPPRVAGSHPVAHRSLFNKSRNQVREFFAQSFHGGSLEFWPFQPV